MLHKDWRICRGKEYRCIYNNGKRIPGQYIIVFVKENQLLHNRFGIVTSKKLGNAVIRNRSKRIVREVIRNNLDKIKTGFDVVIVVRFNIREAVFDQVEKDYLRSMRKAGMR